VKLAEQWSEVLARLPRGWDTAWVALALEDETQIERAALILGPAAPGRSHATFRLNVAGSAHGVAPGAELVRRVLTRLDREGVRGRLTLVEAGDGEARDEEAAAVGSGSLASQWQGLLDELPPDWSHLLAQVDLDSSDYIDRGALLLAPANPLLAGPRSLRFRAARRVGYGVAAGMARRCLERLDGERITGRLRILRVVSEDRPVATQGPVWRIGGKAV
jgi:hypothetical protein